MDRYELEAEYKRVSAKLECKLGGKSYRFVSDGYVKEFDDAPDIFSDTIRIRKATDEEIALQAKKRELYDKLAKYR